MIEQRNPINNPTFMNKYNRYINNFREEHVPERYNQILL